MNFLLKRAREDIEAERHALLYDIRKKVAAWGGMAIVQQRKEPKHQPLQEATDEWLAQLRLQGFGGDWV